MSVKGTVFTAIGQHLMQKLQFAPETGLPSLQWFDKDFGQAKLIQDGVIALPMPAVLFSFKTPDWGNTLSPVQHGETMIRVRVLFENYADSFQTAEGASINQDKALQFFEFNERVHMALQGFEGNGFTALNRASDDEDDDHNNVIVTDVYYSTLISDDSADRSNQEDVTDLKASAEQAEISRPDYQTDHGWVIPK